MAQNLESSPRINRDTMSPAGGKPTKVERKKRVYDHEMSEKERFALACCLKAKNALSAIAVQIQEGKGCSAEIVKAALAIQAHAADTLFRE